MNLLALQSKLSTIGEWVSGKLLLISIEVAWTLIDSEPRTDLLRALSGPGS